MFFSCLSHNLSLLHLFFHFPLHLCSLCLCSCFVLPISIRLPSSYLFLLCLSISQYASSSAYNVFFLLPLEVNLNTYLTTWLSLCPVRIFPRSHLIFSNPNHNKVSLLKWINIKSTHINSLGPSSPLPHSNFSSWLQSSNSWRRLAQFISWHHEPSGLHRKS